MNQTQSVDPSSLAKPQPSATWAMFAHLASLSAFFIPFGHIVGPLFVWLAKRDDDEAVRIHGRSSLNFQITLTLITFLLIGAAVLFFIASLGAGVLQAGFPTFDPRTGNGSLVAMVLANIGAVLALILLLSAIGVLNVVLVIVNAVRAYDGKPPAYWPAISFLRA